MISWGGRFPAVLHVYGIFMFIFLELIFNCVGHPCEKMTITNSLNLQIVLLMLPMAVIISSSAVHDCTRLTFSAGRTVLRSYQPATILSLSVTVSFYSIYHQQFRSTRLYTTDI